MTLQRLRQRVGTHDFFRILRRWARVRAGENVTTPQLIRLAERISGQRLDRLFESWLYKAGKPTLSPTSPGRVPPGVGGGTAGNAPGSWACARTGVARSASLKRQPTDSCDRW
jgi:hypothetical protein